MLRIAFAGTPEFALPALEALAASTHSLVGVLTQPDRPAGRGRALRASAVKQRALELQVPVAQPARLASEAERAELAAWRPDLLVVVAYGLLLPPAVLALPRLGAVNVHASLLPRWRGAAPIQRALLAGDARSGVTIMQLDAGLDTGPILAQRELPIPPGMTSALLHEQLARIGAPLLLEVIEALAAGQARPRAQPQEGVSYAPKIGRAEARIDWALPAVHIARQVCACNPRPVAQTLLAGVQLRVWMAHAQNQSAALHEPPGTVLGLESGSLLVACGEGVLAIESLQSAGRRVLGASDFAHGHELTGLMLG
ncbi:MAG TPA: methionyl-tRNA formyltransferase [Steroidobacteraceae bacterium]|nr:methionyl-tRNA formyltransferase [Steroidobacteraceae bacterium]